MALQDLLILDHFLYSFTVPEFNRLRAICDLFKHCDFKKISRPDTSYEGVYLTAQDGSYFEMLKNAQQTPNVFALAVSSLSPHQDIVPKLPSKYPSLTWFTEQIFDPSNNPWYTYYGQVPIKASQNQGLIFWAMQYHNLRRHRAFQYKRKAPSQNEFTIQEFISLRIKIPASYLSLIRTQSQWLPGHQRISDEKVVLRILNPSSRDFEIIMEVDEESAEHKPISLTTKLVKNTQIVSQQIKGIHLTRLQDKLIINF